MPSNRLSGEIEFEGDVDWFAVELTAGQRYKIVIGGSMRPLGAPLPAVVEPGLTDAKDGKGTLLDPTLEGVYDSEGTLIPGTSDDDSGEGRHARLFFTPETTGTYYVAAGGNLKKGEAAGTYTVFVNETTESDEHTANTGTTGAIDVYNGTLSGGAHLTRGDYDNHTDVDWFEVTLEAGTEYRFDAVGRNDSPDATTRTAHIVGLYDDDGERVSGTAHSGGVETGGGSSRFFYTPAEAGTYYVAIGQHPRYESTRGSYFVGVRTKADDLPHDKSTTALLTVGTTGGVEGEIEWRGDRDWLKAELEAGQAYHVSVGMANPSRDGDLPSGRLTRAVTIFELSAGDQIAEVDMTKTSPQSAVFYASHSVMHYFEVGSDTSRDGWELMSIGGYRLTVEEITHETYEEFTTDPDG